MSISLRQTRRGSAKACFSVKVSPFVVFCSGAAIMSLHAELPALKE